MLYYIMLFIVLVFLAYVMGITIVTIIDKHLSNISINLPKNNIVVNIPDKTIKETFENNESSDNEEDSDDNDNDKDNTEGFENLSNFYIIDEIKPVEKKVLACQQNHIHTNCIYGKMNYPNPSTMSPIDKRYFKYNYQQNLTLQDYINWLWLYDKTEEDLPYIHLKNLYKLKKGDILEYKNGILPPISNIRIPKNTADYFNKLYNTENVNINCPLDTSENCYSGFNYNEYPEFNN